MRFTAQQFAVAWILACLLLGAMLALSQPPFQWGRYEFDVKQPFTGIVLTHPYPALAVFRRQDAANFPDYSVYPLVLTGRRGTTQRLAAYENLPVTVLGRILCNGKFTMVEIDESSIEIFRSPNEFPPASKPEGGESVQLRGEIVDAKSYAGFAEPGQGSMLVGPSSNAIRGGIPPVIVVSGPDGLLHAMLLIDAKGNPYKDEVLGRIGVPIELGGKLLDWGGVPVLQTDLSQSRKLWPWE